MAVTSWALRNATEQRPEDGIRQLACQRMPAINKLNPVIVLERVDK